MFTTYLNEIRQDVNWAAVARKSGLTRSAFSKHFNGNQPISPKNYGKIFRAIISVTGASKYGHRIWMLDPENSGIVLWLSADNLDDQDKRGMMDAHDLSVYLSG